MDLQHRIAAHHFQTQGFLLEKQAVSIRRMLDNLESRKIKVSPKRREVPERLSDYILLETGRNSKAVRFSESDSESESGKTARSSSSQSLQDLLMLRSGRAALYKKRAREQLETVQRLQSLHDLSLQQARNSAISANAERQIRERRQHEFLEKLFTSTRRRRRQVAATIKQTFYLMLFYLRYWKSKCEGLHPKNLNETVMPNNFKKRKETRMQIQRAINHFESYTFSRRKSVLVLWKRETERRLVLASKVVTFLLVKGLKALRRRAIVHLRAGLIVATELSYLKKSRAYFSKWKIRFGMAENLISGGRKSYLWHQRRVLKSALRKWRGLRTLRQHIRGAGIVYLQRSLTRSLSKWANLVRSRINRNISITTVKKRRFLKSLLIRYQSRFAREDKLLQCLRRKQAKFSDEKDNNKIVGAHSSKSLLIIRCWQRLMRLLPVENNSHLIPYLGRGFGAVNINKWLRKRAGHALLDAMSFFARRAKDMRMKIKLVFRKWAKRAARFGIMRWKNWVRNHKVLTVQFRVFVTPPLRKKHFQQALTNWKQHCFNYFQISNSWKTAKKHFNRCCKIKALKLLLYRFHRYASREKRNLMPMNLPQKHKHMPIIGRGSWNEKPPVNIYETNFHDRKIRSIFLSKWFKWTQQAYEARFFLKQVQKCHFVARKIALCWSMLVKKLLSERRKRRKLLEECRLKVLPALLGRRGLRRWREYCLNADRNRSVKSAAAINFLWGYWDEWIKSFRQRRVWRERTKRRYRSTVVNYQLSTCLRTWRNRKKRIKYQRAVVLLYRRLLLCPSILRRLKEWAETRITRRNPNRISLFHIQRSFSRWRFVALCRRKMRRKASKINVGNFWKEKITRSTFKTIFLALLFVAIRRDKRAIKLWRRRRLCLGMNSLKLFKINYSANNQKTTYSRNYWKRKSCSNALQVFNGFVKDKVDEWKRIIVADNYRKRKVLLSLHNFLQSRIRSPSTTIQNNRFEVAARITVRKWVRSTHQHRASLVKSTSFRRSFLLSKSLNKWKNILTREVSNNYPPNFSIFIILRRARKTMRALRVRVEAEERRENKMIAFLSTRKRKVMRLAFVRLMWTAKRARDIRKRATRTLSLFFKRWLMTTRSRLQWSLRVRNSDRQKVAPLENSWCKFVRLISQRRIVRKRRIEFFKHKRMSDLTFHFSRWLWFKRRLISFRRSLLRCSQIRIKQLLSLTIRKLIALCIIHRKIALKNEKRDRKWRRWQLRKGLVRLSAFAAGKWASRQDMRLFGHREDRRKLSCGFRALRALHKTAPIRTNGLH